MRISVLVVGLILALSGCGGRSEDASTPEADKSATPGVQSQGNNGWIEYADGPARDDEYREGAGAQIASLADLDKLHGADDNFVNYIGSQWQSWSKGITPEPGCDGKTAVITVLRYHPSGFAVGGAWACAAGGNAYVWVRKASGWDNSHGSEMGFDCQELKDERVPAGAMEKCWQFGTKPDGSDRKEIAYTGP